MFWAASFPGSRSPGRLKSREDNAQGGQKERSAKPGGMILPPPSS